MSEIRHAMGTCWRCDDARRQEDERKQSADHQRWNKDEACETPRDGVRRLAFIMLCYTAFVADGYAAANGNAPLRSATCAFAAVMFYKLLKRTEPRHGR